MRKAGIKAGLVAAVLAVVVLSCNNHLLLAARYTVEFYTGPEGSYMPSQVVGRGELLTQPERPPMHSAGYVFSGWYTDHDLTRLWDFDTNTVNNTMTLYARWGVLDNALTVRFDTRGGFPVPEPAAVDHGEPLTEPPEEMTRGTYRFSGWYTDYPYDLTSRWDFYTGTVITSKTLYARWVDPYLHHDVLFDANGGTPVQNPLVSVAHGEQVDNPGTPEKQGHTFQNWYTNRYFTVASRWRFDMPVTRDITLYARWRVINFPVTFIANGGTPIPNTVLVAQGQTVAEPNPPTRSGHSFVAWYDNADFTPGTQWNFYTPITENVTLHARWEPTTIAPGSQYHTVHFNVRGGTPADLPSLTDVPDNIMIAAPMPEPTRVGHKFGNWYSDETFTRRWDFDSNLVTRNMTLHARWVPIMHQVEFILNEGEPGVGFEPSIEVAHGNRIPNLPPEPTRSGYTFISWFTDTGVPWLIDSPVESDVRLTAQWDRNPPDYFTISFRDNVTGETIYIVRVPTNTPGITMCEAVRSRATDKMAVFGRDSSRHGGVHFNRFRGWFETRNPSSNTPAFVFTDEITLTRNIDLWADWGYRVGDKGPGGGIIFYRHEDGPEGFVTYKLCMEREVIVPNGRAFYLEAARSHVGTMRWQLDRAVVTSFPAGLNDGADRLGRGHANTAALYRLQSPRTPINPLLSIGNFNGTEDAGGKDDWFLPSLREFQYFAAVRASLDGTWYASPTQYWTSTLPADQNYIRIAYLPSGMTRTTRRSDTARFTLPIRYVRMGDNHPPANGQ